MATCGLPMRLRQRLGNDVTRWSALRRLARAFAVGLAIAATAGCATTITFGSVPRIDRLETLKVGGSNGGDVVRALGEPRGRGQSRFQADFPETQVWFYEYMQTDGQKAQVKMLLVFVHNDLYVGHMWFSSGQLLGVTQ